MRVRACAADELARVVRFGVPLAESAPAHDGLAGALRAAHAVRHAERRRGFQRIGYYAKADPTN